MTIGFGTVLAVIGHAQDGNAQQTIEIAGPPACASCEVQLTPVVTLGERMGEGFVSSPTGVGRLSDGRWVVAHRMSPSEIVVFGPSGKYLRKVGRRGEGPGEFQWITYLAVGTGDTTWIYDAGRGRLTALDARFDIAQTYGPFTIKPPNALLFGPGDTLVAVTERATTDAIGYPVHLLDRDGNFLRSLGAVRPVYRADRPLMRWRSLAWAGERNIWSAPLTRYTVERWDLEGSLRAAYARQVDWFPPHEQYGFRDDEPPNPGLIAITTDDQGHLWTMVRIAGENWQSGVGLVDPPGRPAHRGITDYAAYYDTVIEVIDPASGELIASTKVESYLVRFLGDNLVVGYREDAAGYPSIRIWRLTVAKGG